MIFNYKNILNDLARNDNSLHQITTVEKKNLKNVFMKWLSILILVVESMN